MLLIFSLLIAYQLKHFFADYPLQANRFMLGKFLPGWKFVIPLLAHVSVHGIGTFLIALVFGTRVELALGLSAFDAGVHFIMDRIKSSPRWMGRWKPLTAAEWKIADQDSHPGTRLRVYRPDDARKLLRSNKLFWISLGFDQLIHHLTHYACIWMIIR